MNYETWKRVEFRLIALGVIAGVLIVTPFVANSQETDPSLDTGYTFNVQYFSNGIGEMYAEKLLNQIGRFCDDDVQLGDRDECIVDVGTTQEGPLVIWYGKDYKIGVPVTAGG